MTDRTLPGIGLKGFWALGEDNWKDDMDANLLALSVLVQGRALSLVNATPGSPTNGDVHLFGSTHPTQPNKLAVRDNGAWVYYTPLAGWRFYNIGTSGFFQFNGVTWTPDTAALTAEDVRDVIAAALVQGTNVTIVNDDPGDTITISAAGGGGGPTDEQIQDMIAAFLLQGSNVTLTYDDTGNHLTIAASGGGGGGSTAAIRPSIVQSVGVIGMAVTFPSPLTPGNLLVALATHWDNTAAIAAGWTQVYRTNGASFDGVMVATRIVMQGDSATQTPVTGSASGCNLAVFEIADHNGQEILPFNAIQESAGASKTLGLGSPCDTSLVVGAASTISANTAPSSIVGATALATVQGVTGSASPRQVTPFYASIEKGTGQVTVNYAASATQYIMAVTIQPRITSSTGTAVPVQASARSWRVRFVGLRADGSLTAASGFAELTLKDTGGTTISVGGTASASSVNGGSNPASNAFDGNTATAWYTANGRNIGEWIGYDFGIAKAVGSFTITPDPGFPAGTPRDFALDYSSDGVKWTTHSTYAAATWVAGTPQTFTVPTVSVAPSSNKPWYWSPPLAAQMTAVSGDATLPTMADDTDEGLLINFGGSVAGDKTRAVYKTITAPAADWLFEARMNWVVYRRNYIYGGLFLQEASSGKMVNWGFIEDGAALNASWCSNLTGGGGTIKQATIREYWKFFRITYTAATNTLAFYVSVEGKMWQLVFSELATAHFTTRPDRCGFCITTNLADATNISMLSIARAVLPA